MEKQGINLFIVDDNNLLAIELKYFLQNRFGEDVKITTFNDGDSCLAKIDNSTDVVILDYCMDGKNGLEVLKEIKKINPKTEVIMLSGNEDMAIAIQTFRSGAKDYVIKGDGAWRKITKLLEYIIMSPIRIMVREFGVSKFMAIFLLTFVTMGIVTAIVLHFITE